MYASDVRSLSRITFNLGIYSFLLTFCACVTDDPQNSDINWDDFLTWKPSFSLPPQPWERPGGIYPWEKTDNYPWKRTGGPYPWKITRDHFPWGRTLEPYPWKITREHFPWERTLEPYPWEITIGPYPRDRKKITTDYNNDDYDSYKRTDTSLKLIIFIPPFVILSLFLVCKYCVFNEKSIIAAATTVHVPPRRLSCTPGNNTERAAVSTISNDRSQESASTATDSEKPPDYTTVILSDRSERTPRYPSVIIESEDERPPSYYDAENLSKY